MNNKLELSTLTQTGWIYTDKGTPKNLIFRGR
jgi:hypothetical protein